MMHWGRVGDPILHHLPGLAPNHWKPDIEMLKVHYGEKSPLIQPHQESALWRKIAPHPASSLGPLGLWVGAVGSPHSSTCGYHFIVVVFIYSLFTVSYFV